MTAIGFPSRVLVKRGNYKKATSASVFLPFGTNIKANPPKKEKLMFCQLCFLSHLTKKATQKKQKLAKGTRENARMNSAVVV